MPEGEKIWGVPVTGKAAAFPKFSGTLTLSQSGGAEYAQALAKGKAAPLPCWNRVNWSAKYGGEPLLPFPAIGQ